MFLFLETLIFSFHFFSYIIFFYQIPTLTFPIILKIQSNDKKKHYQSKYQITITIANDNKQITILDFSVIEYFS